MCAQNGAEDSSLRMVPYTPSSAGCAAFAHKQSARYFQRRRKSAKGLLHRKVEVREKFERWSERPRGAWGAPPVRLLGKWFTVSPFNSKASKD